jgi:hypothetical protein
MNGRLINVEYVLNLLGYSNLLWALSMHFICSKYLLRPIQHNSLVNSYRNSQQDATVYQKFLFYVYMKFNMFRKTHRPSSGAQNCSSSLWFSIRERLLEVDCLLAGTRCSILCPLASSQQICMTYIWRSTYSRELLVMDGKTVRNM